MRFLCLAVAKDAEGVVSPDSPITMSNRLTLGLVHAQAGLNGRLSNIVGERYLCQPDARRILLQVVLVAFLRLPTRQVQLRERQTRRLTAPTCGTMKTSWGELFERAIRTPSPTTSFLSIDFSNAEKAGMLLAYCCGRVVKRIFQLRLARETHCLVWIDEVRVLARILLLHVFARQEAEQLEGFARQI